MNKKLADSSAVVRGLLTLVGLSLLAFSVSVAAVTNAPTLLTPSNGATNVPLSNAYFSWDRVDSTMTYNTYRIVISENRTFSGFAYNYGLSTCDSTCFTAKTNSTSYYINMSLAGHTYYWAVQGTSWSFFFNSDWAFGSFTTKSSIAADDHGNNCSTATAVNVNSSLAGTIGTAGDWDYFRVQVPSAGTLTVYTDGSTDTYGFLKNASCANIPRASSDNYNGNNNFRIAKSVTAGTYYVAVRNYSTTGTGGYILNVGFQSNDRFTWPVDPTKPTDGHLYACGDSSPCFWIDNSIHDNATVWRDAQVFQRNNHLGADYNLAGGDDELNKAVYPASVGTISKVVSNACGFGNIVFVKHSTSFGVYTSMYAHVNWLTSGKPTVGALVSPSEPITLIGKGIWTKTRTCKSTGSYPAHLHFEIRRGDQITPGPAYKACKGSDDGINSCPNKQVDPNTFIKAHN